MGLRVASKVPFHTPDEVAEWVAASVMIADGAELTVADRAALLPGILSLLSQHQIEVEQTGLAAQIAGLQRPPRQ